MRVTCIIIFIILHTTHNIFHISYNIVHTILSYAMRPWNHGLDITTSQNEFSTHWTSSRDSYLANTESVSFIHAYFIYSFKLFSSLALDSYRNVTSFINFNTFDFHNYSPLHLNVHFIICQCTWLFIMFHTLT